MYGTKQPIVYFFLGKDLFTKEKLINILKRQLTLIPCGRVAMHRRREKPKNFCFS